MLLPEGLSVCLLFSMEGGEGREGGVCVCYPGGCLFCFVFLMK